MLHKFCSLIFLILIISAFTSFPQQTKNVKIAKDSVGSYTYYTIPQFWGKMEDVFHDPNFNNAIWGVEIQSIETGEYFYKRNENKLLIPASDIKLFTTAGALTLLGNDYKFSTNILMRGKIDGSVLMGDLIVQGRGDPTISGRFYNNDQLAVFKKWADSLSNLGIDEIDGNIIGDDNEFDDIGLGEGWPWDHASYWFSAPSGAISFNDNTVDVIVNAKGKEVNASVNTLPATNYIVIINNVKKVSKDSVTDINIFRQLGTNIVTVFGTIKDQDSVKTFVTVNNPTQYAMVIFKQVLESKGINVKGFPLDIDDLSKTYNDSDAQKLFTYFSPPLKEIIKVINKNSENFFAEQLIKTIGLEENGFGSVKNGVEALRYVFLDMGIDPDNMTMVDGSGLSRLNLVTPKQLVNLLNYMFKSKYFVPFYNSLPIAGVDGTLGTRMKGTRAENNVRAKTGYLENVRSMSGYVYTGDNEPIAYSIIVNNFNVPIKLTENIQDLVCLRLANFKRK